MLECQVRRVLLRVVVLMVWLVGASLFVTQARGVVLLLGVFGVQAFFAGQVSSASAPSDRQSPSPPGTAG